MDSVHRDYHNRNMLQVTNKFVPAGGTGQYGGVGGWRHEGKHVLCGACSFPCNDSNNLDNVNLEFNRKIPNFPSSKFRILKIQF